MTLLLLAGTGEALQIAQGLAERRVPAIASLAGATRAPESIGLPTRIGGFGGPEGFCDFVAGHGISAVLDATHPFASQISIRTARICEAENIPYCQVLRPEWTAQEGDDWVLLDREEDATRHIPTGATVFLATGRQTLPRFANLQACRLICRQIDSPDAPFPFPNGEFIINRPPFAVEEEYNLFKALKVEWLVVKNAGGAVARTKLVAARQLGLPVAMINRPRQPDAPKVETVAAALEWVAAL